MGHQCSAIQSELPAQALRAETRSPLRLSSCPLIRADEKGDGHCHRTAQPYTQPIRENLFPFLMLEIKSEATDGVLYAVEN